MNLKYIYSLLSFFLITFSISCDPVNEQVYFDEDFNRLYYKLTSDPNVKGFRNLITRTDYANLIKSEQDFTIIAPKNQYYSRIVDGINDLVTLPKSTIDALTESHLISGHVNFSNLPYNQIQKVYNLRGNPMYVSKFLNGTYDLFTINGKSLDSVSTEASNGRIYYLNGDVPSYVYPDPLNAMEDQFEMIMFREIIKVSEMESEIRNMKNVTLYVPSNEALAIYGFDSFSSVRSHSKEFLQDIVRSHIQNQLFFTGNLGNSVVFNEQKLVKVFVYDLQYNLLNPTYSDASLGSMQIQMVNGKQYVLRFADALVFGVTPAKNKWIRGDNSQFSEIDYFKNDIVCMDATINLIDHVLTN